MSTDQTELFEKDATAGQAATPPAPVQSAPPPVEAKAKEPAPPAQEAVEGDDKKPDAPDPFEAVEAAKSEAARYKTENKTLRELVARVEASILENLSDDEREALDDLASIGGDAPDAKIRAYFVMKKHGTIGGKRELQPTTSQARASGDPAPEKRPASLEEARRRFKTKAAAGIAAG